MHKRPLESRSPAPSPTPAWSSIKNKQDCACGASCSCKEKHPNKSDDLPAPLANVVRSAGQPLDHATRAYMEPRFGRDFSHIRVHRDSAAAHSARSVDANAFSVGSHLVFDEGRFDPSTTAGRRLLAHELAHTVQQERGVHGSDRAAEKDADHASVKAVQHSTIHGGEEAPALTSQPSGEKRIQRQPKVDVDKDPPPDPADTGRDKLLADAKNNSGDAAKRAQSLMNQLVTRYFPEYQQKISAIQYDPKEPNVSVDVKETKVGKTTTQSATVKVGKKFVDGIAEDTLRMRLEELGHMLLKIKLDPDPSAPRPDTIHKLIKENFPLKTMRVASTAYDKNQPGLFTDFSSGKTQAGGTKIEWSGPKIYYGKAFVDLPEADKLVRLRAELDLIDKWRVENAALVGDDLKDRDITMRLRGLKGTDLVTLRDKVKDPKVKEYVASLVNVSTPLEEGLQRQPDDSLNMMIGAVKVVVLTDVVGTTSANANADTPADITFSPTDIPSYHWDRRNNIDVFPGYTPTVTVTIRTTYDAFSSKNNTQGYGKGTLKREKALDATSVRYHEGEHGLDIIRFVKANALPTFSGKVGDTKDAFETGVKDYIKARKAYAAALQKFTDVNEECPGDTIDKYMKGKNPKWKNICPAPPKPKPAAKAATPKKGKP